MSRREAVKVLFAIIVTIIVYAVIAVGGFHLLRGATNPPPEIAVDARVDALAIELLAECERNLNRYRETCLRAEEKCGR